MQNAMQLRPPVAQYQSQMAHPIALLMVYLLSFTGLGVVIGPLFYFLKPLSRHHAAFIFLISLLVLGVAALYYYEVYWRYDS